MEYTLEGKTIIITGANSGIGKAATVQMVNLGATVIMACRSIERGMQALQDVKRETGRDTIEMIGVDMSSQKSIHQFTDEFSNRHDRLDILIHNAANFDLSQKKPVMTEDGIESILATNHIGVFLMTHLLLKTLKKSTPSRIITVASKGLITYPNLNIEFDNLNGEKKFSAQHAYYHSKLAQIMFTYELARRLKGTGITANCVRVANVAIPEERLSQFPDWLRKIYSVKRKISITPEKQSETYVFLAASPAVAEISGAYWDENNHQVRSNANSYNQRTWEKLWDESARLAGITNRILVKAD